MSKPVIAAQLYTIRNFTKTAEDFAASMKKVKEIGFSAVQISAIGPIPDAEVMQIVSDNGLTICNTHIGYDKLWNDIDAVIETHKTWNCPNVAIGSLPGPYREEGEGGFKRFAQEATAVGEKLAAVDLTFSYHNHSFEFMRFGGRTALEIIYEESDPRYLQAEIDTYWIQHGGGDPVKWILTMKDRMPVIHLKDFVVVPDESGYKQVFAEVGEGNLDWHGILGACETANVAWAAIEQDTTPGDPFDSLKISYDNLKAMGYA